MHSSVSRLLAVLLLVFLFDFLFWEEKLGLNALLFTFIWTGSLLWAFPEARSSRRFYVVAASMLLSAIMTTWHNSGAAKLAWAISAMCTAGFAQERQIRFLLYAWMQYLYSVVFSYAALGQSLFQGDSVWQKQGRTARRALNLSVMPLLVVIVFYFIYLSANAKFAELSGRFWRQVAELLSFDISLAHVFFCLIALLVCGGALWSRKEEWREPASHFLQRIRRTAGQGHRLDFQTAGLRTEYGQSILLLAMLNVLLFIVNLTDVFYVWFGFDAEAQYDLKSYVHMGTYILIASILVAMGVLFYIFRNNLNFYPRNRSLKHLAAAWLIQNGILAVSVAVRDWRYIDFHGLAYKRIGVFLFLLLVFTGLITLWMRIRDRRNNYWLWSCNSWAFYGLMLGNACVNWDVVITRYNLSGRPRSTVDVSHMILGMSNKNLYVLEENLEKLQQLKTYPEIRPHEIQIYVEGKRANFEGEMAELSWKSWNVADARNRRK